MAHQLALFLTVPTSIWILFYSKQLYMLNNYVIFIYYPHPARLYIQKELNIYIMCNITLISLSCYILSNIFNKRPVYNLRWHEHWYYWCIIRVNFGFCWSFLGGIHI